MAWSDLSSLCVRDGPPWCPPPALSRGECTTWRRGVGARGPRGPGSPRGRCYLSRLCLLVGLSEEDRGGHTGLGTAGAPVEWQPPPPPSPQMQSPRSQPSAGQPAPAEGNESAGIATSRRLFMCCTLFRCFLILLFVSKYFTHPFFLAHIFFMLTKI